MRQMTALALLLIVGSAVSAQAEQYVYLLGRLHTEGSTFGEIALFYDENVTDLEKCNKALQLGRKGRWQYYQHMARIQKGSGTTDYLCIATDLQVSDWLGGCCHEHVYLVDRRAAQIRFQHFDTPAACTKAVRRNQPKQSANLYFARSNQDIRAAPVAPRSTRR